MTQTTFKLASPALRIAPSLLAANFCELRRDVELVEAGGADLLHLDVMDGHFVQNISFGAGVIQSLRPFSNLCFDAHLMIEEPKRYAESFIEAGCDHITFHIEVADDPKDIVDHIRSLGASVGICINPTTPVSAVESVITEVDLVLVMSVWPGSGGQAFIADVLEKVEVLRGMLKPNQRLQIDGGITPDTVGAAVAAGVDTLVAGSAIFRQFDPVLAISRLRQLATEATKS